MTVSYNLDVSSVSCLNFFKLLFRWRGSIWKSVANELALWLIGYYAVFVVYRTLLNKSEQGRFVEVAQSLDKALDKCVPLTFMLAFFVTVIVDRWKNIFANIGFIENVAISIATIVRGTDEKVVLSRRTLVRYLVLSQVLVFRDISLKVRRRFPNTDSIVKAGFLHEHEAVMLDKVDCNYNKYWVPVNWASTLLFQLHKDTDITPALFNTVWQELKLFRTNLALLCNFDWVPIPLAYPQVVFLAVRVYFLVCLVARQYVDLNRTSSVDYYFPLLTVFQFVFFMGWLKVAEGLLNPLGEDDDDFECNFLIDKNIATGMAIVDQTYDVCPPMLRDKFADPSFAPVYSEESQKNGTDHALLGSAQTVTLANPEDIVPMVSLQPASPTLFGESGGSSYPRSNSTARLRRKISDALGGGRVRSHSVQPVSYKVEDGNMFSKSLSTPQRPYGVFELSDGFVSTMSLHKKLPKVEEESGSMRSHVSDNEDDDDKLRKVIEQELATHHMDRPQTIHSIHFPINDSGAKF
ncbi:unnamed protein product [Caenorhabditis auriculariae]|uniref:Bestrophin homolog n=1 Tax=Caenorhabditis auriculariae TaxID=2777116 RepID=A0A8S1HX32_9PELO|nr:unnamed protein product [Caenorhabditis auriculariae]